MNYNSYLQAATPLLMLAGLALLVYLLTTHPIKLTKPQKDTRKTKGNPMTTYLTLLMTTIICGAVMLVPLGEARNGWGSPYVETQCPDTRELAAIPLNTAVSTLKACMTIRTVVLADADYNGATNGYYTVNGVINVEGPDLAAAPAAIFTINTLGFVGCAYGSQNIQSETTIAQGTGARIFFALDITELSCRGLITLVIGTTVLTTIASFGFVVNIHGEKSVVCAPGGEPATCEPTLTNHFLLNATTNQTAIVNVNGTEVNVNVGVNGTAGSNPISSLYVLFLTLACFLAFLAETRRDYFSSLFAGILFLVVGFISIWEQDKLGFDEVPGLLIPMLGFTMIIGVSYLVKTYRNWRENKQ